jgi:hypothetical protein
MIPKQLSSPPSPIDLHLQLPKLLFASDLSHKPQDPLLNLHSQAGERDVIHRNVPRRELPRLPRPPTTSICESTSTVNSKNPEYDPSLVYR